MLNEIDYKTFKFQPQFNSNISTPLKSIFSKTFIVLSMIIYLFWLEEEKNEQLKEKKKSKLQEIFNRM